MTKETIELAVVEKMCKNCPFALPGAAGHSIDWLARGLGLGLGSTPDPWPHHWPHWIQSFLLDWKCSPERERPVAASLFWDQGSPSLVSYEDMGPLRRRLGTGAAILHAAHGGYDGYGAYNNRFYQRRGTNSGASACKAFLSENDPAAFRRLCERRRAEAAGIAD